MKFYKLIKNLKFKKEFQEIYMIVKIKMISVFCKENFFLCNI